VLAKKNLNKVLCYRDIKDYHGKMKRVCKPKESGKLGLRDLKLFNTLLRKWGRRFKTGKNSLWNSVLSH
jgi:hypothetical protein